MNANQTPFGMVSPSPAPSAAGHQQQQDRNGPAPITATSPSSSSAAPAGASAAPPPQQQQGLFSSAARIPFLTMCRLFEQIGAVKAKKADQLSLLSKLWTNMKGASAKDRFQVLRLLLPQLDTRRSVYGLKESKVARFYIELLGLSDTSPDAIRLRHWKDPSRSSLETTIFSDTVYMMLMKRGFGSTTTSGLSVGTTTDRSSTSPSRQGAAVGASSVTIVGMTVQDINNALDALSAAQSPNDKKAILFELLRSMCAVEHKWLIRIIMKEMKMHLSQNPILGNFHPMALDLFNSTNDLEYVCEECSNPTANAALSRAAANGAKVFLGRHFTPMLASNSNSKLATLVEGERICMEPKYDGERVLLHFDASQQHTTGDDPTGAAAPHASPSFSSSANTAVHPKILYFSRRAKSSAQTYAAKFDPVIKGAINWGYGEAWRRGGAGTNIYATNANRSHNAADAGPPPPSYWGNGMVPVHNCVLDGEMLLYNKHEKRYEPFGHNRTFAKEGRGGDGDGGGEYGGRGGAVAGAGGRGRNSMASASSLTSPSLFGGMVIRTEGDGDNSDADGDDYGRNGRGGKGGGGGAATTIDWSDGRHCYQFQIFDIVFLNGECLCTTPLERRKELLRRVIRPRADEVEIVRHVPLTPGKEMAEAMQALEGALDKGHEGIMLKMMGSHYIPAERKLKWMKLKSDHIAGLADTLDLIILGAYYGTKYGSRSLSHFLLGCYVDDAGASLGSRNNSGNTNSTKATAGGNLLMPPPAAAAAQATALGVKREREGEGEDHGPPPVSSAAGNPTATGNTTCTAATSVQHQSTFNFKDRRARFHTVCKVGTGYNMAELRELNAALADKWITLPRGAPAPEWLDGWRPGAGEVPDVYIHPADSAVMEVYGFSMTETVKFKFGHTVRFPRCNRLRYDKDVEDATTTSQVKAIIAASCSNQNGGGGDGGDDERAMLLAGGGAFPAPSHLLTSRRAGDMREFITMKEAKKLRRERGGGGGGDANAVKAKRNIKGEGDFGGDEAGPPRKTLVFASRTILAPRAGTVDVISDLFSGYEMCVLQSNIEVMEQSALQRLLISHGAQVVANPQPNTSVILACSRAHIKVQNWIDACVSAGLGDGTSTSSSAAGSSSATAISLSSPLANFATIDIVNVSWALECITAGALLPLVPSNTVYASARLLAQFRRMLDPYQDPYFRPVASTDEMRQALRRVLRGGAHKRIIVPSLPLPTAAAAAADPHDQHRRHGDVYNVDGGDGKDNDGAGGAVLPSATPLPSSSSSPSGVVKAFPQLGEVMSVARRIAGLKRALREEFPIVGEEKGVEVDGGAPLTGRTPIAVAASDLSMKAALRAIAGAEVTVSPYVGGDAGCSAMTAMGAYANALGCCSSGGAGQGVATAEPSTLAVLLAALREGVADTL